MSKTEKEKQVSLPVRVPEGLLDQLRVHCEANDLSLSNAVRVAIHQYLDGNGITIAATRPHSDLLQAVGHLESAANAIAGLGKLIKK